MSTLSDYRAKGKVTSGKAQVHTMKLTIFRIICVSRRSSTTDSDVRLLGPGEIAMPREQQIKLFRDAAEFLAFAKITK